MSNARAVIEEIRSQLKPVNEQIFGHPYLSTLEQGKVPRDCLRAFAGQQYHIVSSDLRSVSTLVGRHGHLPSRVFLMNILQGEAAAMDALLAFGEALDLDEEELQSYEPSPEGQAYCLYVAWLGSYGSDAEVAGAFLVNFPAWGFNCGRMAKALRTRYGFKDEEVAFFDLFASVAPFDEEALEVIQAGLDRGVGPRLIIRAARLLQAYELMFWDAMVREAGI
jgi:pyrroloquinoline quinone (PQQ) biosynthesis protein C